jgi:RNA polymerase primary sigma factor
MNDLDDLSVITGVKEIMVARVAKKRVSKSGRTATAECDSVDVLLGTMDDSVTTIDRTSKSNRAATATTRSSVRGTVEGKAKSKRKCSKTFKDAKLESSFVNFVQLSFPEASDEADLQRKSKRIASTEIAFIGSPDLFSAETAESEFMGEHILAQLTAEPAKKSAKLADLPVHLARLCETKLLTPDEEKILFFRMNFLKYRALQLRTLVDPSKPDDWLLRRIDGLMKASDWHRDCIVKSNMRLVISIIKKFVNQHNGFDDLLSDGIVAVLRAVEKFDVALGFRFSTYATQVVRRNTYRKVMEKQKERQKNIASLSENGLDFSDDQKSSSMSEERWHALRNRLALMLDHLDRREKFIIRARFSLGGHRKVQTLQRLADVLGVSKERIRQLEKRALDKLRGMTEAAPILPDSDI